MKWDESKHPRDELGRFTDANGSYRQNAPYRDILSEQANHDSYYISGKDRYDEYPTVYLPWGEYNMVMHELATNLTEEERKQKIVTRSIRNYTYTVVNNGFGNYRVIKKKAIKPRR